MKKTSLLLTASAIALCSCLQAQTLVVNDNLGTNTERGVAFDLTNTSTTDTVSLTGLFNLAVTTAASEGFNLWIRTGTVFGNVGDTATDWTDFGTVSATGQSYASPGFTLTSYDFTAAADFEIAAGETIGIWLKDSNQSASYRYVSGGSNTVIATSGFTDGGLQYSGFYGLGVTGDAPNVANSLFGPTRNFVGEIGYTVVPEPSTFGALLGLGALGVVALRRRRS